MVIKTAYHFVDSNQEVEISSKKQKKSFWKLFCLGGGQMTYLGEGALVMKRELYVASICIICGLNNRHNPHNPD